MEDGVVMCHGIPKAHNVTMHWQRSYHVIIGVTCLLSDYITTPYIGRLTIISIAQHKTVLSPVY